MGRWLIIAFLMMAGGPVLALSAIDSLRKQLTAELPDNQRLQILLELSHQLIDSKEHAALKETEETILQTENLAIELKNDQALLKLYDWLSGYHLYKNQYAKGTKVLMKMLKVSERISDTTQILAANYKLAGMNFYSGRMPAALRYSRVYLALAQAYGNKKALANGYTMMSVMLQNISDSVESAVPFFEKEIALKTEMKDTHGICVAYNNYAALLTQLKRYTESEFYLREAISLGRATSDSLVIAYAHFELGHIYIFQHKYAMAAEALKVPVGIWRRFDHYQHLIEGYKLLSEALFKINNTKDAYRYLESYVEIKDKLDSLRNVETMDELEARYEGEKKDREIKMLQQKQKLQAASERQYQIVLWSVSAGLFLVLVFSFFIYRGLRQKRLTNKKLAESYSMLEEKNTEILDSIHYAKRIQDALLKGDKMLRDCPVEHQVIFMPRDIVSGDFYWSLRKGALVYIAVADCTGHGVPGALLTMLGGAYLNEIVSTNPGIGTADLLNGLRERIMHELNQRESLDSTRDGMDISVLRLNVDDLTACWSGANNPLWVFEGETLTEIKPDKQPIGFSHHMAPFTQHNIVLKKNALVYMFSDGFADQFGGESNKKLKITRLKQLVTQNHALNLPQQVEKLVAVFRDWKGSNEQTDDVCVLALRV